jgi:predicted transport protein
MRDLTSQLRNASGLARRLAIRRCVKRIDLDFNTLTITLFVRPLPILGAVAGGTVRIITKLPEAPGALVLGARKRMPRRQVRNLAWHLRGKPDSIRKLVMRARGLIKAIAPRITESYAQEYIAFSVGMQFAWIKVQRDRLRMFLSLDQSKMKSTPPNFRDVTHVGTHAGGNSEFVIMCLRELLKCRPFLAQSSKEVRERAGRYFKTEISDPASTGITQ